MIDTPYSISTLGEDASGELYVGHHSGELYRVIATADAPLLTVVKIGGGYGTIRSSPAMLECGSICGAQVPAGTSFTLIAAADAGSTFAGWSGSGCAGGSVQVNADVTCTATFAGGFTDDVVVAGVTAIRAVHILELRNRIDAARVRAGLTSYTWTDATLATGTTSVRAVHVSELRTALTEAYAAASRPAPSFTDPALGPSVPIRRLHIVELRQAVMAVE
jgi:hypothetical protein